jgi:hypothetical protein
MENLRQAIEKDLGESIEGEWKMPVELTSPDGEVQKFSANNPTSLLGGQVLYASQRMNPNTGEVEVVDQPVVSLRVSSLSRIPQNGETWFIKIPIRPVAGAPMHKFIFSPTRAIEHGTDIGFIKLYLQQIENEGGAGPVS